MIKKLNSTNIILGISVIFLFLICLYPFLTLFGKISFPKPAGVFDLKYFLEIFDSKTTLLAIKNTMLISLGTAVLSTIMALPLSWLLTRTNIPGAKKLRSWFCLPYAIPPYIGAIAWIYLGNPTTGLLNIWLGEGTINVYTYGGLIWVMSCFFYTFVLLSLLAAMDRMDPSLEEAARLSGAGPLRVFFQITIPIIMPALLSGVLLVVLAASASFGVPAMIGNPASIYLVTTRIYTFMKMGSLGGTYTAGALSIILLILAILVLWGNQRLMRKGHFKTVGGKTSRPSLIDLGPWRLPLLFAMGIGFIVIFIMPVFGILVTALSKVQGTFALDNFGFQNFHKIFFETDETPRALWNSTKLAFWAATIAVFFGMILSYIVQKTKIKGRGVVEILASLPYATPGTVLAFAFILTFSSGILGFRVPLYNTIFLIGMAYIAKYLNFSLRTCGDGFGQIDDVLAEAARVSGASWLTTMRTIWFPLMKPALVASWFLVFMPCFSELTMTILLSGPGLETLGTLIFQLQEYADASGGGSAVLALITISIVGIINYSVKTMSKGKYGL